MCWTVPCTTPHSGDDGLGEPPQSVEWRNGIAWTPPLTFVVDLWLSLARGISAITRLTLTNCSNLFYLLDLWLSLAGGISAIAWLIMLFYFLLDLWLSLVGGTSTIARLNCSLFFFISLRWHHVARLNLLYLTELLCDYVYLVD